MKWIKSLVAIIVLVVIIIIANLFPISTFSIKSDTSVDSVIFPHNEVVDVNIQIDEDVYADMLTNAMDEEIVKANITYNGYTFSDVGIRTKGNSSLRDVAQSDSDRYSLKVDFNYYLEDQDFLGITKINLNNIFKDPSMMAEYLGYEMLDDLDAVSSRTTYVALSINGTYSGLYLSVEQVNDSFLTDNYGDDSGELYKPDMGVGSDLAYISDDGMDYTGMFPENMDDYDNEDLVKLIKAIEDGSDLDSIFNVDSFLKYLAVSTMTLHSDSYQGAMYHNYYLYNNDGVFEWISWDLNMIFNGFDGSGLTDLEATEYLIDEPVTGAMSKYPLIEAIFKNEEYVEKYHEYLKILSEGYLEEDNLNEKISSVHGMIKDYVETDPTAFYSYEEFEKALFTDEGNNLSLLSFAQKRVANVAQQLSGDISSTNNGEGNSGSGGGGGMGQKPDGMGEMPVEVGQENADGTAEAMPANPEDADGQVRTPPEDADGQVRTPPEDADGQVRTPPEDADGQMRTPPEGADGQMKTPPQGIQDEAVNKDVTVEASANTTSSADIIIFSSMVVLIIGGSVYLSKKHF
ncbi:CotH kinase family protein [Clostridium sp.]|uniref:CotH kinase family protein n=1 Tax=Clostridium sp. TaxID=1506 RepID=UPI001A59FC75|nr:CotH kinase family protein [Clostridium sp.]MBK5241468.1 CotH kinase family protein [Clostridium sp.]